MTPIDSVRPYIPAVRPLYLGLADLVYALFRVVVGLSLVPHGGQKLFGMFGGVPANFVRYFASLGLEPAALLVTLVGIGEFFGGLLIAFGLLTRPAALWVAISTLVATVLVHMPKGFFTGAGGFEFPLIWGMGLLLVAVMGGGRFSLDRAIGREF
jgi:putative oxidoreductase